LHIHAVVEECEIVELLHQIDPKTKKPIKKKVLFVKNGAVVVCRLQVCFAALLVIKFTVHFPLKMLKPSQMLQIFSNRKL
jgi:translation elongation factor EF-1alpha